VALLGIDIGGTKTAVCVGTAEGQIFASRRMPSLSGDYLEDYFRELSDLCTLILSAADLDSNNPLTAVGVSAPGPLDCTRGVLLAPPNNPGWTEVPVVERLAPLFDAPLFLNNDANACALAELYYGEHNRARNLIYLTASTGMGAGLIVNGRLLQGVTDHGGEVGHQVLDPSGPPCPCGKSGCWEVYVGGKSVADRVRAEILDKGIETRIVEEAGGSPYQIDHRAIAAAARAGDEYALRQWDVFTERLAQGVGNLIQVFNPEVIVLGTMAVNEGDFLMDPLREKLPRYTWKWPLEACTVVPSSLGSRAGDLSALAVARAGLEK
jgi:glucokinase